LPASCGCLPSAAARKASPSVRNCENHTRPRLRPTPASSVLPSHRHGFSRGRDDAPNTRRRTFPKVVKRGLGCASTVRQIPPCLPKPRPDKKSDRGSQRPWYVTAKELSGWVNTNRSSPAQLIIPKATSDRRKRAKASGCAPVLLASSSAVSDPRAR